LHDPFLFANWISAPAVCDAGIAGLERIPSLTSLSLASCESITNVTNLFRSKSLRRLILSSRPSPTPGLSAWSWRLRWKSSNCAIVLMSLTLPLSSSARRSGR
jgi:hypothetical protein